MILPTTILAFSLSTDAFAAAVAKGARFPGMSFAKVALIAFGFGFLEALAPLLGYLLGLQFAGAIEAFGHWIAFAILGFLGSRMIWTSFRENASVELRVDATAVGITPALFSDNIPLTLLAIGSVTFMMRLLGLRLGSVIGERTGHWAELVGGLRLVLIGTNILLWASLGPQPRGASCNFGDGERRARDLLG